MEIAAYVERWPRCREHRSAGGRFRMEIEVDWDSSSIRSPRGPRYGFAAAAREPLVRLKRPKFDFELWDWGYFAWPHDRLDANLEMRDSDPDATLEADKKASDSFLNRSTLLIETYAMDQDTQEQSAAAWSSEQLDGANHEMRNSEPEETIGSDRKAIEGFQNWSTLQLEGCATGQYMQEQNAIEFPSNQHSANQGLKNRNLKETPEADQKASKILLSRRSTLQRKRREMDHDQHMQEQHKEPELQTSMLLYDKPAGHR